MTERPLEKPVLQKETVNGVEKSLGALLLTLTDLDKRIPEFLLHNSEAYLRAIQRWEIVRKDRGPKLLSSTGSATGFEGYLYGTNYSSDLIQYHIATYIQKELDNHVKAHPGQLNIRKRMENTLFGHVYTDLTVLKYLESMFNNARLNLYHDHIETNKEEDIRKKNQIFFEQTAMAVSQTPKPLLKFNPENGNVTQQIVIPSVPTTPVDIPDMGIPIPNTGWDFAREIGIVGNPILRSTLGSKALIKYMELKNPKSDRVHLVWKNSPLYDEFKEQLALRFYTEIFGPLT